MEQNQEGQLVESLDADDQVMIARSNIPVEVEFAGNEVELYATMDQTGLTRVVRIASAAAKVRTEPGAQRGDSSFTPDLASHSPRSIKSVASLSAHQMVVRLTVRSARLLQLDDDSDEELLICGTTRCAWFGVVHLNQAGSFRSMLRTTRSWAGGDFEHGDSRYICLDDVRNDGRLDLILPCRWRGCPHRCTSRCRWRRHFPHRSRC